MALRPVDLAAKALCDVNTARRWLKPELRGSMKPAVAERVRRAAEELGYVEGSDMHPTPDTPLRLSRKGEFAAWLASQGYDVFADSGARLAAAYPEGGDFKADPAGPDRESFIAVAWKGPSSTTGWWGRPKAEWESPEWQATLARIIALPGCGESARQMGLMCTNQRPPEGHLFCSLGKYHGGECNYPKREPGRTSVQKVEIVMHSTESPSVLAERVNRAFRVPTGEGGPA